MSENIVEIKKLSKQFGTISALDKVSIDIPSKSIFGILGPNGSGKSTLMRIISGLIKKWDGEIKILGEHVHSSNTNYLNSLGFMIESQLIYKEKMNLDQLDWKLVSEVQAMLSVGVLEVELPLNLLEK